MRTLPLLLVWLSAHASAALFSQLAPTPTGSVDEVFSSCFADPECNEQVQPLIARLKDRFGSDLNEVLHNCLMNARSMRICTTSRAKIIANELEILEANLAQAQGPACAKRLIARATKTTHLNTRDCYRQADGLGEGADRAMSRTSCGADENQSILTEVRRLKSSNVCSRED